MIVHSEVANIHLCAKDRITIPKYHRVDCVDIYARNINKRCSAVRTLIPFYGCAAVGTVPIAVESLSGIVSDAVNAADRAGSNAKLSEDARDASVAAKNQAEQAKKDAEGYRADIEQAKKETESARDEAVAADKSAGESKTVAAESEKNAKDAESRSTSNAESAEGWAVGQHGGVPVPESDPSYQNNSKHYANEAKNARDDVADSVNGVAQESTAAAMLENLGLIVGYLQTIIERGNSSGDLNGFALNRTENGEVVLSYTNPDDETDTDSITMPTNETLLTLKATIANIADSLAIMTGRSATNES